MSNLQKKSSSKQNVKNNPVMPKPNKSKPIKEEDKENLMSSLKTTPIPETNISCSNCSISSELTEIFHAECNFNHNFCFPCIYSYFFGHFSETLNNPSSLTKTHIVLKCPGCANISTPGVLLFPFTKFIEKIKHHLSHNIPSNFTKTGKPCPLHNNPYVEYCNDCSCYLCKFCVMNEHFMHNHLGISDKEVSIKDKIKKMPLKIKDVKKRGEDIKTKNQTVFDDIYTKTTNEITKLISILGNLKALFEKEMTKNFKNFEMYSEIVNVIYSDYYEEIKNINSPFIDYGITHGEFLNKGNEEIHNIQLTFHPAIYQEVELACKNFSNGISKEKMSSAVKFNIKTTPILEYKCVQTIKEHANYIKQIIVNNEQQRMITCSEDKNIKIFDTTSPAAIKCLQTLKGHNDIVNAAIQGSSTRLVTASEDYLIKIWDHKGNEYKCTTTLKGHTAGVQGLTIINNDDNTPSMKFASAAKDNTIKIWEPKGDYKTSSTISAHSDRITALVYYHPSMGISSSLDKTVKIWDLNLNNKNIHTIKEINESINYVMLMRRGGNEAETEEIAEKIKGGEQEALEAKEREKKKSAKTKPKVTMANAKENEDTKPPEVQVSFPSEVKHGIICSNSNSIGVVDLNTITISNQGKAHTMPVVKVKVLYGNVFGSLGKDKTICIWDMENNYKLLTKINVHNWEVFDFCYCSEKKKIYTASQDKTIKDIEIVNSEEYSKDKTKELIWRCHSTIKGHERDVTVINMLNADTIISTGKDFMIKVWKEE